MFKNVFFVILSFFTSNFCFTQNVNEKIFSLEEFIALVKTNHPIAKQASIKVEQSEASVLSAKGNFDPNISIDATQKTFDGKNYYNYFNPELKIPLPVGDIKTGIEDNGGGNLNSEFTAGRSSYFGIELPLAKGLLIDKRRAVLKQNKIFVQQSVQEQKQTINNLLLDAYVAYAKWTADYQLYQLYSKYVNISNQRLQLLKILERNGDKSVMDTLEAFTQLQNIQILQSNAQLNLLNAVLDVSNYLWLQNDSAFVLAENIIPNVAVFADAKYNIELSSLIDQSLVNHPILKSYNFKLEALEVERKLKAQSLWPTLNTKVNLLNKDYAVFKGFDQAFFQNNNKWGIDFKMPLFIREGRGELKRTKLKINETQLDFELKKWELENKIRSYYNEFMLLQQQLKTALQAYENYNKLYQNELLRFNNGESSLFILNSRENKALEFYQKTIELRLKLFKARFAIDNSAGILQ
jgi:outer membrane protein TolC